MKYDETAKKALHLAQVEADRTIARIEADMGLGDAEALALAHDTAGLLRRMPPAEREQSMLRGALALADLQALCQELEAHLGEVGAEITRVRRHAAGLDAYARVGQAAAGRH